MLFYAASITIRSESGEDPSCYYDVIRTPDFPIYSDRNDRVRMHCTITDNLMIDLPQFP